MLERFAELGDALSRPRSPAALRFASAVLFGAAVFGFGGFRFAGLAFAGVFFRAAFCRFRRLFWPAFDAFVAAAFFGFAFAGFFSSAMLSRPPSLVRLRRLGLLPTRRISQFARTGGSCLGETSPRPGRDRRGAGPCRRGAARGAPAAIGLGAATTSRPRTSTWSIAFGPVVGESRPKSAASRAKTLRVLGRAQVEVAAEDQRRVAGPLGRRLGRAQHVLDRQRRLVVGRVQVGDADARGGAGEGHRAPLRLALVDLQLAPLGDPAELPRHPHQGRVRAALAARPSGPGSAAPATPARSRARCAR